MSRIWLHARKIDDLEAKVTKFNVKNGFGDKLAMRLAKIEAEADFAEGRANGVIQGAQ